MLFWTESTLTHKCCSSKITSLEVHTCLARSATLEFSILLSCVSSSRMTMSSSARVGSRPQSWSWKKSALYKWAKDASMKTNNKLLLLKHSVAMIEWNQLAKPQLNKKISTVKYFRKDLTMSMVTRTFFLETWAWEKMLSSTGVMSGLYCSLRLMTHLSQWAVMRMREVFIIIKKNSVLCLSKKKLPKESSVCSAVTVASRLHWEIYPAETASPPEDTVSGDPAQRISYTPWCHFGT